MCHILGVGGVPYFRGGVCHILEVGMCHILEVGDVPYFRGGWCAIF